MPEFPSTQTTMNLPSWNSMGIIPPASVAAPVGRARSPYPISIADFVVRFAISSSRVAILRGLLAYRTRLAVAGMSIGFQWVDGSFLENIELLESRSPRDVDVVTFFQLPGNVTQDEMFQANPDLFDLAKVKRDFQVDAYFVSLSESAPAELVADSAYWYSLWGHRRNGSWKGYAQVELDPAGDAKALGLLPGGNV